MSKNTNYFDAIVSAFAEFALPEPAPQSELDKVTQAFPNWKKTVATETFYWWLQAQPYEVKRLCYSELAEDAIKLLQLFENRLRFR